MQIQNQNRKKILAILGKFFHFTCVLNFWYFPQPYFIGQKQRKYCISNHALMKDAIGPPKKTFRWLTGM